MSSWSIERSATTARGLLPGLILTAAAAFGAGSSMPARTVGLVPAEEAEITAALAAGARLALAHSADRTGGPLALEVGELAGGWAAASEPAVRMAFETGVIALITPPDRATAHLLAQLGSRAHLPVVSTAEARSVTAAGSYWVVSVAPAGAPGEEFTRAFRAAEGRPPDRWAVLGYDAAAAVAEAVSRAGLDRGAVVEAWRGDLEIVGASGPFGFDRSGRRAEPIGALASTDILALFAESGHGFEIVASEPIETDPAAPGMVGGERLRLRSVEPIRRTGDGPLHLSARLERSVWSGSEAAAAEVARRLAAAHPDTGLSYAWDFVAQRDSSILHLHVECTLSEEGFRRLAAALSDSAELGRRPGQPSFWCRCGGGCRAGEPAAPELADTADAPATLPPVRHELDPGEEDVFDNRLDPSGAWSGESGELSLMHYANTLSFSYLSVFGPAAHICEGAGVAGLTGRDRYEFTDDQGTVAFVIEPAGVRLQLAEGIASFCGAGWTGERFTIDRFRPPRHCRVSAERSHFHVVDHLDPAPRRGWVGRGYRVEVVPSRHTSDRAWVLARFRAPTTTSVGLLAEEDVACPEE